MALSKSASSGDRVSALEDLRDLLAQQIEVCESGRDMAALAARFQSVLADISLLKKGTAKLGDPLDEIATRRAARGGSTARPRRTERVSS